MEYELDELDAMLGGVPMEFIWMARTLDYTTNTEHSFEFINLFRFDKYEDYATR